jgi:hypothetical protein
VAQEKSMDAIPEIPVDTGGRGAEPYLTPAQSNKIVQMMTTRQKNRHRRCRHFDLDDEGMQWAKEVTKKNMQSEDGRVSNGAVRNWLGMNAHNRAMDTEEWEAETSEQAPQPERGSTNVNVNVGVALPPPPAEYGGAFREWARATLGIQVAAPGPNGAQEPMDSQGDASPPAAGALPPPR